MSPESLSSTTRSSPSSRWPPSPPSPASSRPRSFLGSHAMIGLHLRGGLLAALGYNLSIYYVTKLASSLTLAVFTQMIKVGVIAAAAIWAAVSGVRQWVGIAVRPRRRLLHPVELADEKAAAAAGGGQGRGGRRRRPSSARSSRCRVGRGGPRTAAPRRRRPRRRRRRRRGRRRLGHRAAEGEAPCTLFARECVRFCRRSK